MIVIDASTVVGAALKADSVPWQTLLRARQTDIIAMSDEIATEIRSVLRRPKFSAAITPERFAEIVGLVFADAEWFYPTVRVTDCRDPKDNKYLELALEAGATLLVSSDNDLLSLGPWRDVQILRPAEYLAVYGALIGS